MVGSGTGSAFVKSFTLDTNCLIDIDEGRPAAAAVLQLVDAHAAGRADVAVVAVSGTERQKDGGFLEHYAQFRERLDRLGLGGINELHPIAHWGVGFYGHGYYGGTDEMRALESAIQAVLHPHIPISYTEFCEARDIDPSLRPRHHRWRNALCDVQILWSHIHNGRCCFVTSDGDFFKESKLPELERLGVRSLLKPESAVQLLPAAT